MPELLYPRLPPAVARSLFREYRVLPLDAIRERSATRHQDAVFTALGGAEVPEVHLSSVADAIRSAAADAGYPAGRGSQSDRERFDLTAAEILHRKTGVVAAEASSIDVWAFVGAVLVPDVCFWRFPDPPEDRVIGPDLTRHTFARLWWRAHQLHDLNSAGGLAALSLISESEMNQLFERRSIGGNRRLVRAVATILTSKDAAWADGVRRDLIRDATSRVRRLLAFTMLEALDDDELHQLIDAVFQSSNDALQHGTDDPGGITGSDEAAPLGSDGNGRPDGGPPTDTTPPSPNQQFDLVLLGEIPVQLAELVRERGGMAADNLVPAYERRYGVRVPDAQRDIIRRFAWSAKGRRFLDLDEDNNVWLPGQQPATPIEQLSGWTIATMRHRAHELIELDPETDPFETLLDEVYRADGAHVPRLVTRLVRRVVNEARRERGR